MTNKNIRNAKVTIIILNWNGFDVTRECLESLLKIENNIKIIIVDNGSVDDSINRLSTIFNDSRIDFLPLKQNLGFTGGNNKGILYAKEKYESDYFLLLNNDTIVENDFLDKMILPFYEDDKCYAVVPKIFFFDNPDKIWFAGGSISRLTGIVKHFGLNNKDSKEYNELKSTGFMNGCCALISKTAIEEIGILDNRFFANSEDADYSIRILDSGHKIKYQPEAVIYHKVNHSFKANKGKWLAFYLAARGIVLLQNKHLPSWKLPFFYVVFFIRWIFYLTLKLLLLGDLKSIVGIYKGAIDGINNRLRFVV